LNVISLITIEAVEMNDHIAYCFNEIEKKRICVRT